MLTTFVLLCTHPAVFWQTHNFHVEHRIYFVNSAQCRVMEFHVCLETPVRKSSMTLLRNIWSACFQHFLENFISDPSCLDIDRHSTQSSIRFCSTQWFGLWIHISKIGKFYNMCSTVVYFPGVRLQNSQAGKYVSVFLGSQGNI